MADPLYINKDPLTGLPELSANELRQAMALALQYGGRNLGARTGVRPGGTQLQVSLNGSVITVQPGVCCIDPGLTAAQGPYWVAVPGVENPQGGPLVAADASNPRKDIVIGRVYDHDEDGLGLRLARTEYLAGVAAAAPNEPNVPAGAFRLATIDVPKVGGGAPVVTNNAPYTVAAGGLLPVRNKAERDAITFAYDGFAIWRMDRDWVEIFDGAKWRVQGSPCVANTADFAAITDPYDGQPAYNLNDKMLYRWNATAAAWRVVEYRVPQTLTASQPTITFPNIPSYLRRLKLSVTSRGDSARSGQWLYLRINGDPAGTTNYRSAYMSTGGNATLPDTGQMVVGFMPGANVAAGIFGSAVIDIVGWDSPHAGSLGATTHSQVIQDLTTRYLTSGGGQYKPAGPYTSLTLLPEQGSFVAGTEVVLEGTP